MLCIALAAALCAPAERPVIAEVLYDPAGDDTGNEFVELYSPASVPVALAGLRLEAGDGSGPNRWTLRWTGALGDTLRPGARFVIGGMKLATPPNAVVTLDLQNGPDAVRLVWPDGATEVLGWGAHEFAEYFCGEPAPDVASGFSLARMPDDTATGSNLGDFRAASPSPGRANQTRRNVAVVAGSLELEPELPDVGTPVTVHARVHNPGRDPVEAGSVSCTAWRDGAELGRLPALGKIASRESLDVGIPVLAAPAGKFELLFTVAMIGDETASDDSVLVPARFGPGPLEITEIQFHPASGEGEWVEVRNRSGTSVDLAGFTLGDRADHGGKPITTTVLQPETLAVLAQDRTALLKLFPAIDSSRVIQVQPWSALNNSDENGVADVVRIREKDGVPVARVDYSAAGVPAGITRELATGGFWTVSAMAGGSPLSPPPVRAALANALEIVPRRLRPGMPARLEWSIPWAARASVTVYDLEGTRVAEVFPEVSVLPRGERTWNANIPPGYYIAVLSARPSSTAPPITATRTFRIESAR